MAWTLAVLVVASGLATAAGALTRISSAIFGALLIYTTLADRLEAFTVSKLGTCLVIALAFTPCNARWSVDAWWKQRRDPKLKLPTHVSGGNVRFFQILVPVFYMSSGFSKAWGDWLSYPYVLFTHLHDSYQTWVAWFAANHVTAWMWSVMQYTTLAFEIGAPLWFSLPWTRKWAMLYGIAMHTMIGLMFGPVIWFALLMITILIGAFIKFFIFGETPPSDSSASARLTSRRARTLAHKRSLSSSVHSTPQKLRHKRSNVHRSPAGRGLSGRGLPARRSPVPGRKLRRE